MQPRPSLADLARAHGTDKEGEHFYAGWYERFFAHLRDLEIRLLEIGVGGYDDPDAGGESLRMWKEYFPRAEIVSIDIHEKALAVEERITVLQGDQNDPTFLHSVGDRFGPFDVIVDDGSHQSPHIITSFTHLFEYLVPAGIYAIEDLQTSYWPNYGGSHDLDDHSTAMGFLKSLVDGINYAEWDVVGYQPSRFDEEIAAITFVHNMAFILRGPNDEPSNRLPAHPHQRTYCGLDDPLL